MIRPTWELLKSQWDTEELDDLRHSRLRPASKWGLSDFHDAIYVPNRSWEGSDLKIVHSRSSGLTVDTYYDFAMPLSQRFVTIWERDTAWKMSWSGRSYKLGTSRVAGTYARALEQHLELAESIVGLLDARRELLTDGGASVLSGGAL